MFLHIKFDDREPITIRDLKNEGDAMRELDKWKGEYNLRQVAAVLKTNGVVFLASRKPKYIWE